MTIDTMTGLPMVRTAKMQSVIDKARDAYYKAAKDAKEAGKTLQRATLDFDSAREHRREMHEKFMDQLRRFSMYAS